MIRSILSPAAAVAAVLLASLAVVSVPAAAQWNDAGGERRMQCVSNPNGENFCALGGNGGPVRLLRSYGPTACVEGSTWRYRYALRSELLQAHPLRELQITVRAASTVGTGSRTT